jgi:hypothetical protein
MGLYRCLARTNSPNTSSLAVESWFDKFSVRYYSLFKYIQTFEFITFQLCDFYLPMAKIADAAEKVVLCFIYSICNGPQTFYQLSRVLVSQATCHRRMG